MTDIHSAAKPDTVLLLDGLLADSFVDFSQYRVNVADHSSYYDESPSERTAIRAPREITLLWNVKSGETGVLLEHGNATSYNYRIRIASGGVVECHEDGIFRLGATIPDLIAGTGRKILIHWSQHLFGTQVRSELALYNFSTQAWVHAQATHGASNTDPTDTLTIGATYGGSPAFSGGMSLVQLRIGRRFHSTTETKEDWVSQVIAPTMTQVRRTAPLVSDRETLTALAGDGALVGPAHLWAGHSFEQADRRLIGALVNVRAYDPLTIDNDYDVPNTAWWRTAPDDDTIHLCIALLWYRPVPLKVNRAHVRLFVRQQNSSHAVTAEVRYRMYSLADLPVLNEPNLPPPTYHRTAQATCTVDHGATAGAGQWLNLGALPLATDDLGYTWFAVGVSMAAGPGPIATTTTQIFAVTVDPYFEPADNGGIDTKEA